MSYDPYRFVLDRLQRHDCQPRETGAGRAIARCPVHEDRLPSLSVAEGSDGRALIYCFAGDAPEDVIGALGLDWPDLFPDGHRLAPRSRQPRLVREPPLLSVLTVLGTAGIGWRATANPSLFVADACPACGARALWLHQDRGRVRASCWTSDCDSEDILDALERCVTEVDRAAA